jgi:hypothetical protein
MNHRRWNCRWIWAATELTRPPKLIGFEGAGSGEEDVFLRRSFSLDEVPERALARITADSRYILYINGTEISRGPIRGDPSKLHYDPVDLASELRRGENTLAIHGRYYAESTSWWVPARSALGLGRRGAIAFELELGPDRWLGSDASWKALLSDAWTPHERGRHPIPIEEVNALHLPVDWELPGFDDSDWPSACEILPLYVGGDARVASPPSNPYGALRRRPIPQLEGQTRTPKILRATLVEGVEATQPPPEAARADEERPILKSFPIDSDWPLTLEGDGTLLVLVDFGEIVSGLVGIELEAPAGAEIELAVRETEIPPQDAGLDPTSPASFRYHTRGDRDRFESFDSMGFRYGLLAIRNARGPILLQRFWVRERLYPVAGGSHFSCSDPLLDRIYEVGKRSVAINAHDAYLDCPSREQRGWTGDAVVHQMVHLTTNSDWGLARWHAQMSNSPRPDGMLPMAAGSDFEATSVTIPEWPLHWIRSLWNLWRYTADRERLQELMPAAENILRWFLPYRGEDGLVCHVDQWVLVDWAALHLSDTSSCLNAQWARALLEFSEISEWLGDAGRTRWARDLHAEIRTAFEIFWDESRGSYVDHAIDGEAQLPMSQHAGATAVWADLVDAQRIPRVLDTITESSRLVRATWMEIVGPGYLVLGAGEPNWDVKEQIVAAQPFYRFIVHDALAKAGRADQIPSLCRDWGEFLERGETSWPELWNGGTHCHGWGSTPTRDLIEYTLGIRPAEPGFAVARIAPRLGDLARAAGAAPTPHGLIHLRVDREAEEIEIDSPVPVDLDRPGKEISRLESGHHLLPWPDEPQ